MRLGIIFILLVVGFSRCANINQIDANAADALIIRTGTSFGLCMGYCYTDYVFTDAGITLTQQSYNSQTALPTKTCQSVLSQADWAKLRATVDFDQFSKQPEQLGCPDCADGGAEYVELQAGDRKHRVTFEYNKTIPGFESLVTALREHRTAFSACR